MNRHVIAVIPVFRPPADFVDAVHALLKQVDEVVIVDDGSHTLASLSFPAERVHTRSLETNSGIAKALNTAVEIAFVRGATHIVTLDQDSRLVEDHVDSLVQLLDESDASVIGTVPGIVGGAPVLIGDDGQVFDPIQSGQVLRAEALRKVGPFAEELFIDAVDSEFTLRARTAGYSFLVLPTLSMPHELGTLVPLKVFGRPLVIGGKARNVLYHSPRRTYYMVRNSRWLSRVHRKDNPEWVKLRNRKMTEMVLGGVLLAPDRFRQIRALIAGWRDGAKAKLGPIPASLLRRLEDKR